jgi:DNA mismatch repair protein PMS2
MVVVKTQGSTSLKDNIITVFGLNTFKCLDPFNVSISEDCQVQGFLSKPGPGNGRNSGDRQFFYVNGRPVDMPKVTKLVNELYRSSNSKQYPVAVLNFCIPTTSYDVNVAPDKRKIFFSSEHTILQSLREAIETLYSPQQCSFSVNHIEDPEKEEHLAIVEPNESTYLIGKENVSSPENDSDTDETDGDDKDPPENQKVSSSVTRLATGAASRDRSPLPRGPVTQVDRSPSLSHFWYEQPKKSNGSYPVRENHARTGLGAKSSSSSTVQPSLMNFLSLNKRKHEDSCNLISEAPVLRRGPSTEQVRRTSLEANAPGIANANSIQENSLLRRHSPQSFVPNRTEVSSHHSEPSNTVSHSTEAPLLDPCDVHSKESDVVRQIFSAVRQFFPSDFCRRPIPFTFVSLLPFFALH